MDRVASIQLTFGSAVSAPSPRLRPGTKVARTVVWKWGHGEAFAQCWMTFSIPATTRVIES